MSVTAMRTAREETDRVLTIFESYAAQVEDGEKVGDTTLALSLFARVIVASQREHSEAAARIAGVLL
jgi:hypothetical protein